MKQPIEVIAIIDVGKTNKKLLLFDRNYRIVYESIRSFPEIVDEDGFPCEDIHGLMREIPAMLIEVMRDSTFKVKAINVAAYGASIVYIDDEGQPVAPLYNYLKPYPEVMAKSFFSRYGGKQGLSRVTASPVLGSLNAGLQLVKIKSAENSLNDNIRWALHLPQFIAGLFHQHFFSEYTSIGCHTLLWNMEKNSYHEWVHNEGVDVWLPPIVSSSHVESIVYDGKKLICGVGIHDSSATLIPYLLTFSEPFILLSTGTWSICLNPFNDDPLTVEELENDCLSYLRYDGRPVKASRFFLGRLHDDGVEHLAFLYQVDPKVFREIPFSSDTANKARSLLEEHSGKDIRGILDDVKLAGKEMNLAYHVLVSSLVQLQRQQIRLVMGTSFPQTLIVDGGFAKNEVFMQMLCDILSQFSVFASDNSQGTALGAALAIHTHWNGDGNIQNMIELKKFSDKR